MKTEDLVRALAADTRPARPVALSLAGAVALATLAVAALALPLLGVRPDLVAALGRPEVLAKQVLPVLLALAAGGAAVRLSCPGMALSRWAGALAGVAFLLGIAVVATLARLPRDGWMPAMMGATSLQCLALITAMSVLPLAAALRALGSGASTRPATSGTLAGLLAGGAAAAVYAVHCTEDSPLFYATWYGLAILLVAGAGAVAGSRLLRW